MGLGARFPTLALVRLKSVTGADRFLPLLVIFSVKVNWLADVGFPSNRLTVTRESELLLQHFASALTLPTLDGCTQNTQLSTTQEIVRVSLSISSL